MLNSDSMILKARDVKLKVLHCSSVELCRAGADCLCLSLDATAY